MLLFFLIVINIFINLALNFVPTKARNNCKIVISWAEMGDTRFPFLIHLEAFLADKSTILAFLPRLFMFV